MRMLKSLLAGAAAAVTAVALTAGPALADPPSGTTPKDTAAVGVGATPDQSLFDQFSASWNKTHKTGTQFFSWDATNPVTQAQGDQIETKSACTTIARPNGGSAGKTALEANATDPTSSKYYCIDYARTASPRSSSDPACSTGGICYVSLAGDAEDWAVRDKASGGSDAPATLTSAQLVKIFECKDTNWKQVGGTSAPIEAYLPQTAAARWSRTRATTRCSTAPRPSSSTRSATTSPRNTTRPPAPTSSAPATRRATRPPRRTSSAATRPATWASA